MTVVFDKKKQAAGSFKSAEDWINQSFDLFQKGAISDAAQLALKALKVQPQHFDALHLMGVIAQQQKNPIEAIQWFKKAISVHAQHAAVFLNMGNAYHELGQHSEALTHFE